MNKTSRLAFTVLYVAAMAGCAGTRTPGELPLSETASWVENPYIEGGLASTECVKNIKGKRSILMKKATVSGNASLGSQIEINVKSLSKVFSELTETNAGVVTGEDFDRVTREVMDQQLMGSRMSKSGYFELEPGVQYLCVMMVLDPAHTRAFYDALMDKSGASDQLANRDDEILYMEFKSSQAQAELEQATSQ